MIFPVEIEMSVYGRSAKFVFSRGVVEVLRLCLPYKLCVVMSRLCRRLRGR